MPIYRAILCLVLSVVLPILGNAADTPGAPAPLKQSEAQALAAQVSEAGSDKSLQLSATTAMQALMRFGENDIPGAAKTAYKAYGKFKDSENLDRIRKQNLLAKASLGSAEQTNLSDEEIDFLTSSTSFRRLSPEFLSAGEHAQIAAEFEKKTGIKRQDFLSMLTAASENKLYVNDPKLAEKVDSEFDGFVKSIPNAEFRAKVREAMSVVPSLTRHKLLVQAVQKMVQVAGQLGAGSSADAEAMKIAAGVAVATRAPAATAEAASSDASAEPAPLGAELEHLNLSMNADEIAKVRAAKTGDIKLDSVVTDALHFDAENETIFQVVSRRYRLLTPQLGPNVNPKSP